MSETIGQTGGFTSEYASKSFFFRMFTHIYHNIRYRPENDRSDIQFWLVTEFPLYRYKNKTKTKQKTKKEKKVLAGQFRIIVVTLSYIVFGMSSHF